MLLYSNFAACTQHMGHLLDFFDKQRRVQQGYPISPRIFKQTSAIISHRSTIDNQEHGYQRYIFILIILSTFSQCLQMYLGIIFYWPICVEPICKALCNVEKQFGLKVL